MGITNHYKGELGEFDYDDRLFRVEWRTPEKDCLHYIAEGSTPTLPKGCIV